MFEKFGEFNDYTELNAAAKGFKNEGDEESLIELVKENGIDEGDAQDYLDDIVPELCNALMAAEGKLKVESKALEIDEPETECAPAQHAEPIMNPPDMNVESTDLEKAGNVEETAVEESQEAEAEEVVEEVKEVAEEGQETAKEGQEVAGEMVERSKEAAAEEDQEAAGEEVVEEGKEAAVAEEIKDPSWYGVRWSEMLDAFEELNGFFRTYRKRDMESQVIPKAKLRMIHDHAVNMAAEIEKAIGAGYGK